jgi:hypothetical protein
LISKAIKKPLQLAEQIRQKRENYLNKPEIYTGYEKEQLKIKEQGEQNFVAYFKSLADKRKASNHDNWISAYNYLETFTKGNLKFADLNEKFCNEFKEYLLTTKSNKSNKVTLAQNSAVSYFNKLKATLKQAYKDGYLHDLRHTYGCLQVDLGTDIYTLQGNMGHSTPRQTMMYGKISDQRKREAADKIKLNF